MDTHTVHFASVGTVAFVYIVEFLNNLHIISDLHVP